jgi:hypothetical protein
LWRQSHGNKESCKEVRKEIFEQEVIPKEVGLEQERKPQGTREKEHEQEFCFEEGIQQELRPQVQPECR